MPKHHANPGNQLTVPEHFYRPPNSTVWYVRLVPSKRVKKFVLEGDFRKSTGHADLKDALPVGLLLLSEKLSEWNAIADAMNERDAKPAILSQALIRAMCASRLYSWMCSDDDERAAGLTADELQASNDFCELTDAAMRAVLAQGPGSQIWPRVAADALDWALDLGHALQPTDPSLPNFVRAFAEVEKTACDSISARNKGDTTQTPEAPKAYGAQTLSSIIEKFREHKAPKVDARYVSTILHAWQLFIDFCGDVTFDTVNSTHIYEFMRSRMSADVKPWSEKHARSLGKRSLQEIFGLARTLGWMSNSNPVDKLEAFPSLSKETEAARMKPRQPFTPTQLNTLLSSLWYDPTESEIFLGKMRTDLGARYWVPLIGTFHGNRVREGVQLVASDFVVLDGVHSVRFRLEFDEQNEDAADSLVRTLRSLKNAATLRTVPVHPTLLELGFAGFVAMRRERDGSNALLFPSSLPNEGGKSPKLGRAYEQAFLRHVRDRLKFGTGFGNHSFRHQLEDRVRDAHARSGVWPDGLSQRYTGRKGIREKDQGIIRQEGSEGLYGSGYTPAAMLPYLKKIDFSDLTLPEPYFDWVKRATLT
jgi:hypothetical protein